MKRLIIGAVLALGAPVLLGSLTTLADTSTLVELDRGEPYDAMVFNGGFLFVGQSRKDFNTNYAVNIYDRADKLVRSVQMSHSIDHLYVYGPDAVIAIGVRPDPNLRHFTIIKFRDGAFEVKDHTIPVTAWGNDWLGTYNGQEYFSDFGGNSDDEAGGEDPNLPAQTIFSVDSSGRAKYNPVRMRSPVNGIRVGDDFFIARFYRIGEYSRNVYRLNIKTGKFDDLFPSPRQRLGDLIALDQNILVVSEGGGNRVNFVDRVTKEVKKELSVDGAPMSMQKVGHCVVVGSELTRSVQLIDVKDPANPSLVGAIDFSTTGGAFRGLRKIAVDDVTGRVYGRSAYPCNPMVQNCEKNSNSIAVADKADTELVKSQCLN